jgi:cell division protein FtsB
MEQMMPDKIQRVGAVRRCLDKIHWIAPVMIFSLLALNAWTLHDIRVRREGLSKQSAELRKLADEVLAGSAKLKAQAEALKAQSAAADEHAKKLRGLLKACPAFAVPAPVAPPGRDDSHRAPVVSQQLASHTLVT